MNRNEEPTGTTPSGSPAPSTGAGRRRLPQIEIIRSEPGIEARTFRPDTGLSGSEIERARDLIKTLLRCKRDLLPPGAKLPEAEKQATYGDAAQIMSHRLRRSVSLDAMRLVAARSHGPNPHRKERGVGLRERHHALLRGEAEATEQHMTEVLEHILDAYFEITPEA